MKVLATRRLSKQQKGMLAKIFEDKQVYYLQFSLKGKNRAAYFTVEFKSIAEASDYLDKTKRVDFDAIVAFLISQAKRNQDA